MIKVLFPALQPWSVNVIEKSLVYGKYNHQGFFNIGWICVGSGITGIFNNKKLLKKYINSQTCTCSHL
jgi:hypothetical protein